MKKYFLIVFLISISNYAQVQLDINNVNIDIFNNGSIEKGYFDESMFLWSGGFYIAGKWQDSIWGNGVFNSAEMIDYLPGNINADSLVTYKIYVVKIDDIDFGDSWVDWKNAVAQGALFYDGNRDSIYNPIDLNGNDHWDENEDKPDLLGDYTAWCVYNDSAPSENRVFAGMNTMGIEVKQTVFAYNNNHGENLSNTLFVRYIIENKGTISNQFDSVYFGIVTDPDIGDYSRNLVGTDTLLNSIYSYKIDEDDSNNYGANPPSFFSTLLNGPQVSVNGETFIDNNNDNIFTVGIDTPLDTAIISRGPLLGVKEVIGAKNIKMTSSMGVWRSFPVMGDPYSPKELFNYLVGGQYKNGDAIEVENFVYGNGWTLNSQEVERIPPEYMFTGNVVANTDWLCTTPADIRLINSSGPFWLKQNKPIEIMVAYIIGRGYSPLNSITKGEEITKNIIDIYEGNFTNIPVSVNDKYLVKLPTEFGLLQNYPNPFNPTTILSYSIAKEDIVKLKIYNILGEEVSTIVNTKQKTGSYFVKFNANKLPSGVYIAQLVSGNFTHSIKMILLK